MRIGDYNKLIEFQAPSKISDDMGGFTNSYSTIFDVFAAIWPINAKDQIQSDQMVMEITHKIRIRYRRILKSNWRIKYSNRYFAIVSIINLNESNRSLELRCKEIRA